MVVFFLLILSIPRKASNTLRDDGWNASVDVAAKIQSRVIVMIMVKLKPHRVTSNIFVVGRVVSSRLKFCFRNVGALGRKCYPTPLRVNISPSVCT